MTLGEQILADLNKIELKKGANAPNREALASAKVHTREVIAKEVTPPPPPIEYAMTWGIYDDNGEGGFIWHPSEWDYVESHFGKVPLVHIGQPWGNINALTLANSRGGIPVVDLGGTLTPSAMLLGGQDIVLAKTNEQLAAYGKPVIIRPWWEMNGKWFPWGQDPNYRAGWQYIHGKITAPNVKWLWCPNSISTNSPGGDTYFPGAQYVDYVGADIYIEGGAVQPKLEENIKWIKTYGKPIIIGEWGVSAQTTRPQKIAEYLQYLKSQGVYAQLYFNWNAEAGRTWRLDDAGIAAYVANR